MSLAMVLMIFATAVAYFGSAEMALESIIIVKVKQHKCYSIRNSRNLALLFNILKKG